MYHEYDLRQQLEAVKLDCLRLKYDVLIAEMSFTIKALLAHELEKQLADDAAKAGFNPDQPRVPSGNADGGQWVRPGGTHERLKEVARQENWGNHKTLRRHFNDHRKDFNATSPKDYARKAQEFLRRVEAEKLPTVEDKNGIRRSYDPKTNSFSVYKRNGSTLTFYKPTTEGTKYFLEQVEKDLKGGGKMINKLPASMRSGGGMGRLGAFGSGIGLHDLDIFHPIEQ